MKICPEFGPAALAGVAAAGFAAPVGLCAQEAQSVDVAELLETQGIVMGVVTGATPDDVLAGASVYVRGEEYTAVTDSNGIYAMAMPPGAWVLTVFHPAAAEAGLPQPPTALVTVERGEQVRADFSLADAALGSVARPYALDAMEVVVEGMRERRREVGAHVQTLDAETLEARLPSARHVGDLIQGEFTGVRVRQMDASSLCVEATRSAMVRSYRGAGECSGRVAVVLDGIPLAESGAVLAGLSPDAIERVEFLPGFWATTRLGMRAGNGVLYIWTR